MNRIILGTAFIITALILTGCGLLSVTGSGVVVENQYTFDNFTGVSAGYGCNIRVTKGNEYSISVKCDDNIVPYLETYMRGDTLIVQLQSGQIYSHYTFDADIVLPELNSFDLSGGSDGAVSGFDSGNDFTASFSGGSIGDIDLASVGNMNIELSGGSEILLTSPQSSGDVSLDCSGGSIADIRDYNTVSANVVLSGGSTTYLDISGSLSYDLSGGSVLFYRGAPSLNNAGLSGGSALERF